MSGQEIRFTRSRANCDVSSGQPVVRTTSMLRARTCKRFQVCKRREIQLGLEPVELREHGRDLASAPGTVGFDPSCVRTHPFSFDSDSEIPAMACALCLGEKRIEIYAPGKPSAVLHCINLRPISSLDGRLPGLAIKASLFRCLLENRRRCFFGRGRDRNPSFVGHY